MSSPLIYDIRLAPDDQTLFRLTSGPPDVTFILRNTTSPPVVLRLHKALLSHVSEFYRLLFNTTMQDRLRDTLTFQYGHPEVYQTILESIYGRPIRTRDWRSLFEISALLRFLMITKPDPDDIIREIHIRPDELTEYLQLLLLLYPHEVPTDRIEYVARLLKSEIDLTFVPDEVVEALFSSDRYQPTDEMITYRMIDRLVESGRDPQLYRLVRFKSIPASRRVDIPEEIIDKYSSSLRRRSAEEHLLSPALNTGPYVSDSIVQTRPIQVRVVEPISTSPFTGERQMYIRGQEGSALMRAIIKQESPPPVAVGDIIRLTCYAYRMDRNNYLEVYSYEHYL